MTLTERQAAGIVTGLVLAVVCLLLAIGTKLAGCL